MRKIAIVSLLLSLFVLAAQPLSAQTRPRRVGQGSRTQPTTTPQPSTPRAERPPVLGGRTRTDGQPSTPQNQPAPSSSNNDPEEVDAGDVIRVDTTLVTIPVTVMDRNGKFIPNMRQQDFHIYEDGVEQQIAYFASVEKPFTVALVLDTSGSTRFRIDEIQNAAIAFVNQLRPDDRVMVVSFDDEINILSEPTNNRFALQRAILNAQPGQGTRLYDAVDFIMNQRFNRIEGRKAIVLFTDGVDTTSRNASYSSNVRDAEELDALIYPVQYDTYNDMGGSSQGSTWPSSRRRSRPPIILQWPFPLPFPMPGGGGGGGGGGVPGSSPEDYERADEYLGDLARKTGARTYRADSMSNLTQSFALIAEELRRQYSLGYYPRKAAQAGQRRQIAVRVNQPNMVVRARDSYISDPSASNSSAQGQRTGPVLRQKKFAHTRGGNGILDMTPH
ncbi:MAG TPA: VWA domain-containing protein [Pyrinomonadaceae bacterium]